MSDHRERACWECGSLLHHEDRCPEVDRKLDHIYETTDDLFRAGKFEEVDRMIAALDVPCMGTTVLVGWLTCAAMPKRVEGVEKLPSRAEFVAKCRAEFERRCPDRVEGLLKGLE